MTEIDELKQLQKHLERIERNAEESAGIMQKYFPSTTYHIVLQSWQQSTRDMMKLTKNELSKRG